MWGLEAFSQSLAGEVAPYGIKVTIVEPAGYSTDWSGPPSVQAEQLGAYEHVRALRVMVRERAGPGGRPAGDRPANPGARRQRRAAAARGVRRGLCAA
jgi:NAD(P)-dependent dehydrogenase (short-subunit alcohol dehydrogenase family)